MNIIRTNSKNKDFIKLVKQLDAYLKITDGDEHEFYNQFNTIAILKEVVVLYEGENAVGCGAIKKFDADLLKIKSAHASSVKVKNAAEIKRMFVLSEKRGVGIAQKILIELEVWAKELGYKKCVLETGIRQVEAVKFYKKCDYKIIPNYGQYKNMENSICFEKQL
ncbi:MULTISPECIES: GNAT family N-acetyltransferase [unclassified Polaribacter]|uniref:GNAT family N-acetyltransferase n=1 Tax=unclassified Polaribacter TaxID=196858 RepID=UPI0011BE897A|nr:MULTISPECIES: GNAT family N-acetyltransferase [unclassified Polaribacter]TXD52808.1 GNAT family N-acetyltransferase [Polaribacter sp. IC063]TXD61685.1 GNAT family N-acetyltransferase [Polaribacter sp. IC066]